ncbi:hypothetical protein [Marilutibacter spongiae]|uniref:Uncharacterized protein n=1 Tax=Marilutibacter spongiae TaxID=2025720 RepID=A0A7W3TPD6_9GAMM|nr:hypothetical protein [Lysobacter spongiae]MBB1061911.1 hypothetical protein [Lysobacter spongiae]
MSARLRAWADYWVRLTAAWLADWFDLVAADTCHTIAGRLRGWASR